jgi:hypothetical protein
MTYEVGGILFLSLALQLPYIKHDFVLAQEDKVPYYLISHKIIP